MREEYLVKSSVQKNPAPAAIAFGDFVLNRRKELGINQQALAKLLEKHPTYVSKLEKGLFVPGVRVVRLLALFLQVDPDALVMASLKGNRRSRDEVVIASPPVTQTSASALTIEEGLLITNFRALSGSGKKYVETSLKFALAGEGKSYQYTHRGPREHERSSVSLSSEREFQTIPKTELGQPNIIQLASVRENLSDGNAKKRNRSSSTSDGLLESGKSKFEAGETAEALTIFDEALRVSNLEKTRRSIARFLSGKGEIQKAVEFLDKGVISDPKNFLLKASLLDQLKLHDHAVSLLEEQSKLDRVNAARYLVRAADILVRSRNIEKAREFFLSADPQEIVTWYDNVLAAQVGSALRLWNLAAQYAERASQDKEDNGVGLVMLALSQFVTGAENKALETAETLVRRFPTNPWGHLYSAVCKQKKDTAEESLVSLERAVALKVPYSPFIEDLAEFYVSEGLPVDRILAILAPYRENPSHNFYVVSAKALRRKGDWKTANETLKLGIDKFPDSQRIAYEWARNLTHDDRLPEAEAVLGKYQDVEAVDPNLLYLLAMIRRNQGNLASARQLLKRVSEKAPDWNIAQIEYAEVLAELGNDASALALLSELRTKLKGHPEIVDVLYAEAKIFIDRNLYKEAISILEQLVTLSPDNVGYRILLGFAFVRAGLYEDGIREFSEADRKDPESWRPANNLGYALNMVGRYTEAVQHLTNATQRKKGISERDLGVTYSNLAHSYAKLGEIEKAEDFARRAIAMYPDWAEAHYNLALCLLSRGDSAGAKLELETSISLDVDRVLIDVASKRLYQMSSGRT
jgi:tetratricopeptide (TPR) repeat protein/transcriptional regulator with XRE-family HTH domain